MKLQELLESLSSAYDFEIYHQDSREFSCRFHTENDQEVTVDFIQVSEDPYEETWELSFATKHHIAGWNFDITSKGDQFKILATVIKVAEKFVQKYNPSSIIFTAKTGEDSRIKLYKSLIKKFAGSYELTDDYKNDSFYIETDRYKYEKIFKLVKK